MNSMALEGMSNLFSITENCALWCVSYPELAATGVEVGSLRSSTPKRSRHPPSSHAAYEVVALPALNDSWEALFSVIDRIGRAVDGVFTGANPFWTTFTADRDVGGAASEARAREK